MGDGSIPELGKVNRFIDGIFRNDGASIVEGANKVLRDIFESTNLKVDRDKNLKTPKGVGADGMPELEPPNVGVGNLDSLGLDSFRKTLGNLLEKIVANSKLETDEIVSKQVEKRIDTEKNTLEGAGSRQKSKIEKNIQAMAEAAKNKTIMKVFAWVMAAVAVLTAVVTGGLGIAAMVAAGAAAAGTGAAAGGAAAAAAATAAATSTAGGAAAGGAAAGGAAVGGTVVDAAAMAGGSITVDGIMVSTTSSGGFTLSLASTSASSSTVVTETVMTSASEAVTNAMNSVATVKGIAFTFASGAMGLGMQIADETGALEKAQKSLANKLRKNGWKSKDADLAASLIVGISQTVALLIPGIAGGHLASKLMNFFKLGMVTQQMAMVGLTGFSLAMTMPQQAMTINAQYKAGMAEADVQEQKAMIQLINQMIDESQEELQEILEKLQNSIGKTGDIILSALDAQKGIADNMPKVV